MQVKHILIGRRTTRNRARWNEQVGLGIPTNNTGRALLSRRQRLQKKKQIGGTFLFVVIRSSDWYNILYEINDIILLLSVVYSRAYHRRPPTGIELLEGVE